MSGWIRRFISEQKFPSIIFFALIIRLLLLPFSFHSDLNNHAFWGIFGYEFGFRGFYDWLNFGVYARPDYPPLAMILFSGIRMVWFWLNKAVWFLNVSFPIFPSNFVPWFETKGYLSMLKLPGIFGDLGIGYLIFNFLKTKGRKKALLYSSLYLFNPAVIYLSACWGQIDSFVAFFSVLAIVLVLQNNYFRVLSLYFISVMTKATWVPATLVLLIHYVKDRPGMKKTILLTILLAFYLSILGFIFFNSNFIFWTTNLYFSKIIKGAVTLPYITINAFNYWSAILGMDKILDNKVFFNLTLNLWAWLLAGAFILLIAYYHLKAKDIFFTLGMIFFAFFMFAPRIHERYLFPLLVLLPFVVSKYKNMTKYYLILSVVFMLNLYHWWWYPHITFAEKLVDLEIVERSLSLVNLSVFFLMLRNYILLK
ncbi:MAG: hypothetical protein UT39_C0007G0024 [Candidatus Woesebacteria bacterium GW2011_GWA1_39_21]|uniref:Integral membrane protein-like protein n=1 Tax=Candidatus Woesebacteria bacterium GW2011_GWA1_39_21 TaxID=1618550 RepID=A0A0G0N5G5_9BACT|nr:MAG: hypothetical protein UT39_C0007G0024 [Candidatus Woesebacteria bacterium GW2011_GWA1_39_21]